MVGIAFGYFLSWLIARAAEWNTIVTPTSIAIAFGVSVAVGIAFGIYPARKASSLSARVLPRRALPSKPLASALRLCSSAPPVSSGQLVTAPLFRLGLETGIEAAIGAGSLSKGQ